MNLWYLTRVFDQRLVFLTARSLLLAQFQNASYLNYCIQLYLIENMTNWAATHFIVYHPPRQALEDLIAAIFVPFTTRGVVGGLTGVNASEAAPSYLI